jgi:uncharacterized integral membrane protein (TIGR00698 family)
MSQPTLKLEPGVLLCVCIAVASFLTWQLYKPISALMWSFIFSIFLANIVRLPQMFRAGVDFCSTGLTRASIAALGLTVSAYVWLKVGIGAVNALIIVGFAYVFGLWIGKRIGLTPSLSTLIGVGTCICGASAIAATAPAIGAREDETGLALGCITLFGLMAMFTYPLLYAHTVVGSWLARSDIAYGIWCGTGIHEAAQVVAASSVVGKASLDVAVLVKSVRIFMIGPIVILASYMHKRSSPSSSEKVKVTIPTFAIIFVINAFICAILDWAAVGDFPSSVVKDWPTVKNVLSLYVVPFLLATSFAGVGMKVSVATIKRMGRKAFLTGLATATITAVLALVLAAAVALYV